MRAGWRTAAAAFGSISLLLANMAQNPVQAAEVKAFVTGAARPMVDILAPQFERATGHKLTIVSGLPPELVAKVDAGEPFDIIVLSYDVESLIKRGKLEATSRTVLGQTGVGIGIRSGAPKPDFSTVEKFKAMLLNAKFIATSGEGSSGRYVATLLDRLGIADQVKPKIKSGGPGRSAELVAEGEVDLVVSGLPPLLGKPNVEWLGLIPSEINSFVVFTAGLSSAAKEPEAGRALLRFLATPEAMAVYKSKGLDPAP
jgi:molybdate transport system substrate-binding protein